MDEDGRAFELIGVRRVGEHATTFRDRWSFDLPSAAHDVVVTGAPVSLTREEYLTRYPQVSSIADPRPSPGTCRSPSSRASGRSAPPASRGRRSPGWTRRRCRTSRSSSTAGAQALGRARLEDAERRTRYLLRAIVDQIPLGILILEPDGSPLYMNQAFTDIFAQGTDEQARIA
jgi:PAS domain-containing protein